MASRKIASSMTPRIFFVGNLSWATCSDTLKEYFSQFGNVINVNIIYDIRTGFSRGYGFVKMETEEGVKKVFSKEQHYLAPNYPIELNTAVRQPSVGHKRPALDEYDSLL